MWHNPTIEMIKGNNTEEGMKFDDDKNLLYTDCTYKDGEITRYLYDKDNKIRVGLPCSFYFTKSRQGLIIPCRVFLVYEF